MSERDRQTDRDRDRQTDKQTDRQTETDRQTNRQTDRANISQLTLPLSPGKKSPPGGTVPTQARKPLP